MDAIYVQLCDNTTWGNLYPVGDEKDLARFIQDHALAFQRKHQQLPVEGMDYRILRGVTAEGMLNVLPGTERSPVGLRVQRIHNIVDGIREAMDVPPADFDLASVPGRMHVMHDAMVRIRELALAALYPGQGKGQALAAIEGIASAAMQRGYERPAEGIKLWMTEVEDVSVEMVKDGYWPPAVGKDEARVGR